MGLRAPGINLSCPLCCRASYLWSEKESLQGSHSLLGTIFKGNNKAYCPSCGISFRLNLLQLISAYFKKAPLPPVLYEVRRSKEPEYQVTLHQSKMTPHVIEPPSGPEEEPSGIHLKIKSKTIGLKIEMSMTGGHLPEKVIPMLAKAVEKTSEACASIYQICKKQYDEHSFKGIENNTHSSEIRSDSKSEAEPPSDS